MRPFEAPGLAALLLLLFLLELLLMLLAEQLLILLAEMGEHSHASAHWSALSEFGQRLHDYVQKHSYVREQELLPG